jgi:hypothetical protein
MLRPCTNELHIVSPRKTRVATRDFAVLRHGKHSKRGKIDGLLVSFDNVRRSFSVLIAVHFAHYPEFVLARNQSTVKLNEPQGHPTLPVTMTVKLSEPQGCLTCGGEAPSLPYVCSQKVAQP